MKTGWYFLSDEFSRESLVCISDLWRFSRENNLICISIYGDFPEKQVCISVCGLFPDKSRLAYSVRGVFGIFQRKSALHICLWGFRRNRFAYLSVNFFQINQACIFCPRNFPEKVWFAYPICGIFQRNQVCIAVLVNFPEEIRYASPSVEFSRQKPVTYWNIATKHRAEIFKESMGARNGRFGC
jgi:hypothetical protein